MGVPAILRIISDDYDGAFYADWASPEKVIPGFARWVEFCKAEKVLPTAATYTEFTATDDGDHLREEYPSDLGDPENIAHRYVVRTTAAGDGWLGDLTIWSLQGRADRDPILTVWHRVTFSAADASALHYLALCGLNRTIQSVHDLDRPLITGPALNEWAAQADWHARQAKAAVA